ncbi:metal-binding protein [Chloroflexales bacterium ZM16-3]|nr:metal-binding protein [Chloroflexales bacterium ZM16-3]
MPDARTHDMITYATAVALAPLSQVAQVSLLGLPQLAAWPNSAWLVIAHIISGVMFSPDLDLDSAIDNRWGIFFWIWRPYMWLVPHRSFWSHSLVIAPLLRLAYFYVVMIGLIIGGTWLLGLVGIVVPDYHTQIVRALSQISADHPDTVTAFLVGFCTGSAAHSIADWLVTGGKQILRRVGIRVTRDYRNHDRYVPRYRRRT